MGMEGVLKALFVVVLLFLAFGCSEANRMSALSQKDCASAGGKVVRGENVKDLQCPVGKSKIGEVAGGSPAICCL
jgi:hypothetical protein